jgi:DNA-binding transcriptional LysR family regulator
MQTIARRLLPSTTALTCLDAVARSGSFTRAAAALNLTQGAVSRQIALLEEQLGLKLFERTGRGIELTEKGRIYADGVGEVLERIRTLTLDAMSHRAESALSLAILPTFGTRWLMPRMPDFVARHPDITISFATRIGRFDFQAEAIDAAIHVGLADWPGADCKFLMNETVAPVCSPSFLAQHPLSEPEDLLEQPLVEMRSRPDAWRVWLAKHDVIGEYRGGMRFEQFASVAQACVGGLGIALMPLFLIEAELSSGQLVEIGNWRSQSDAAYYFVRPHARLAHPPSRKFENWLTDRIDEFVAKGSGSTLA